MALSLANILGDVELAIESIKTNYFGLFVVFILSSVLGLIFTVNPSVPEIALRAKTNLGSITLAFASGIAGALAFTAGFSTTLIGGNGGSGTAPSTCNMWVVIRFWTVLAGLRCLFAVFYKPGLC